MCESQDRWSIKSWENFLQVAGVVVDSGQETVFGFLPRLKTFEYCLLEAGVLIIFKDHQIEAGAGVVGDGGWIETPICHFILGMGVDPILLSF